MYVNMHKTKKLKLLKSSLLALFLSTVGMSTSYAYVAIGVSPYYGQSYCSCGMIYTPYGYQCAPCASYYPGYSPYYSGYYSPSINIWYGGSSYYRHGGWGHGGWGGGHHGGWGGHGGWGHGGWGGHGGWHGRH